MSLNLNKIELAGRLTKDLELKKTDAGISYSSFTVAVDRKRNKSGEKPVADFISCVAWRQTAEFVAKNFYKGAAIYVSGALQQRTWKDKDGNNRYDMVVVVDEAAFVESKKVETSASNTQPDEAENTSTDADDIPF